MGFPVGYTEVLVPTTFLRLLTFLATLRNLVLSFFHLLGLSDLLDTTASTISATTDPSPFLWAQAQLLRPNFSSTSISTTTTTNPSLSAILIREFLPVIKFRDLAGAESSPADNSCAVCLNEFTGEDEIRCMANCRHVFHRGCVDRWMDHDQRTCPLCRTPFVPDHKVHEYNRRLWEASGVSEFYVD